MWRSIGIRRRRAKHSILSLLLTGSFADRILRAGTVSHVSVCWFDDGLRAIRRSPLLFGNCRLQYALSQLRNASSECNAVATSMPNLVLASHIRCVRMVFLRRSRSRSAVWLTQGRLHTTITREVDTHHMPKGLRRQVALLSVSRVSNYFRSIPSA